jgi:hypothetical protein
MVLEAGTGLDADTRVISAASVRIEALARPEPVTAQTIV